LDVLYQKNHLIVIVMDLDFPLVEEKQSTVQPITITRIGNNKCKKIFKQIF
jgi:hypothetical protein